MYRNLITQKKIHYSRTKAASLAAKLQSSSDFWKELRTCCGERKLELSDIINKQGWFDHFKEVFSRADDRVDSGASELGDDATEFPDLNSDGLNQPISEDEVREA